jgi:hypothetical protein
MRTFLLLVFLLLTGCVTQDCGADGKCDTDSGATGVDSGPAPCDPFDLSHTPESPEVCNGVDDNCNGEVDEGVTVTVYPDIDGDGFGDATAEGTVTCEVLPGWSENNDDCDDADRSVFPGAEEVCDHLDNDCDGDRDEEVGVVRYVDGDGDGYGDPATGALTCDNDAGYVENDRDCDDTNPDAAPDEEEVCDEIDNDCDGVVDDGVTTEFYADLDGDGHGDALLTVGACVRPTGYAELGDDCDDTAPNVYPGADETCDGVDEDCDGDVDEGSIDAGAFYSDGDGDGFGAGTAWIGCDAPAGYVVSSTDCDDGDAAVYPSADERCNGVDDDCDGSVDESSAVDAPTWYGDADGDGYGGTSFTAVSCSAPAGYTATADDCDDLDGGTFPGAPELCDGVDQNCDGLVDNDPVDPSSFWADGDGDGYGDAATGMSDCSPAAGFVADDTDCDDTDASVHPGATEVCDGVDQDCDGVADDGVAISDWFVDADGDGYGDLSTAVTACAAPAGTVADGTDCDASDASVHPGAAEVCDGVDQDCDGVVDDGLVPLPWYADADGDGFGDPSRSVTDCAAPAGYVALDTDCDDGDATVNPAATETCDGMDEDCDGTVDDGVATTTWYLDGDGDGYGDAATSYASCGTPVGYVADGTDCDDGDALIFPEADGTCPDGLDCQDILDAGKSVGDGTYTIDPDGSGTGSSPFDVLCNMSLYGGGWTQAIQAFLDTMSTSTSHTYLYSYGSSWYVSPSTTLVWSWTSYQAVNGTYGYGTGPSLTSTFGCTSSEAGHWGIGCSNGGGGTWKVLPIYSSSPSAATSTICQDRPDVFGAGACRSNTSIWVRD